MQRANTIGLDAERLALARKLAGGKQPAAQPIPKRDAPAIAQLSFAQQRLWLAEQLSPGGPTYNLPLAVRLEGSLDIQALEWSLGEIVRRHETLRTRFVSSGDRPAQVVDEPGRFVLPMVDLTGIATERAARQVRLLMVTEIGRGFDLSAGAPWRICVVRLTPREHVALWTMHHIISDGWSMGVLVREIGQLYEAARAGSRRRLAPLPIQYADFAEWQRRNIAGEEWNRHIDYWRRQLQNAPVFEMPADHARSESTSRRGKVQTICLGRELMADIRALASQEGATLFMTLLAAFQLLLARYSGQNDIIAGTPVAGRQRQETEGLIGFFVNILALRTDLSGCRSFRELLRRTRETAVGAYAHQDLPFDKVMEAAHSRDLVNITFALQNAPVGALRFESVQLTPLDLDRTPLNYDLSLSVTEDREGASSAFLFNGSLFDPPTIAQLAQCWRSLLESAVRNPDLPVDRLRMISGPQSARLVTLDPYRSFVFDAGDCLARRLEAQVRERPDATAVVCGGLHVTYAELDSRANRLARRLCASGAGGGVPIAVCLERSAELVTAALAVLKTGAPYLPMDPGAPSGRIRWIIEDSGARLVITEPALQDRLDGAAAQPVFIGSEAEPDSGGLDVPTGPDDVAYVIYTSGSTGRPKGVEVTHRNVLSLLDSTRGHFGFGPTDVWTLFHSFAFDFSVWEWLGSLLHGGRLIIVPYWISRAPDAFWQVLIEEGVTILNQTPSAFLQLQETAIAAKGRPPLRFVIFGGEALDPRSLAPWRRRYGYANPVLTNMYGITETTVHVSVRDLAAADRNRRSAIGRAIPSLRMYVLDRDLRPAPPGSIGELYVGGYGVARGYLGRPQLTAERFLPDPYSADSGARMYRTGDFARLRHDGDVEYIGRADQQVKVRGHRIELGEIEAVLRSHPGIAEAVAIARGDNPAQRQLVAYFVPRREAPPREELYSLLNAHLPEYMMPVAIMPLEAFPLTRNGKLDRQSLPPVEAARERVFEAPHTPEQRTLAGIWAEVLGVDRVGLRDNFFELGGDSIRGIQVRASAAASGLHFSIQELFRNPTIAALTARIAGQPESAPEPEPRPFELIGEEDRSKLPAGIEDAYPLGQLQAGMLFHTEYDAGSAIYHDVHTFDLRGDLDPVRLESAIRAVVAAHPALRTSFDLTSYRGPLQLVWCHADAPLTMTDLRGLSRAEQEIALRNWMETEKAHGFNWPCPPLVRFHAHQRTDADFQFSLSHHHAILDGWSVATLLSDLFRRYYDAAPVPAPAAGYSAFVARESAAIDSPETQRYWAERLDGFTAGRLPREPGTGAIQTGAGQVDAAIPDRAADALRDIADRTGLPLKSVLLAAHLRAISVLTGQTDVTTGVVSNGRSGAAGAERILGLFLNTLPLRAHVGGARWIDLARAAFEAESEALPHRWYPLAELQKRFGELFEIAFNYVHFHVYDSVAGIGGMTLQGGGGYEQTNFALTAHFIRRKSPFGIALRLVYDRSRFTAAQMERVAGFYIRALEALADNPEARYETNALLPGGERERVIHAWNSTRAGYACHQRLEELIAEQAARTPDRIAAVCDDACLSYAELLRAADAIADALGEYREESFAGVLMDRSLEVMAGVLGVLRAGAAYVPLDPEHPPERLRQIIEDCAPAAILTHERFRPLIASYAGPVIVLDDWIAEPRSHRRERARTLPVDGAAYMIYTSGSTGTPKGAINAHPAIRNRLLWMQDAYRLDADDRVLQKAPLSFDVSVWELFWPLIAGATLVMARPGGHRDARYLRSAIERHEITTLHFVPPMLAAFLEEAGPGACRSIRRVIASGEPLSAPLVEQFYSRSKAVLHNLYGPAEAAVDVTAWACTEALDGIVPIGKPIANVQIYILDRFLEPAPRGTPGELYIGGAAVGRGYLRRPQLTAERFVPDPFASDPGARLYRTGDLARWLPDGEIEFLGRVDFQIKIRGQRIEPAEIEAALRRHPAAAEAVVIAHEEAPGRRRLVAYLVLHEGQQVTDAEVRKYLEPKLPDYMVPSAFVTLGRLPLTVNGKVDRRALPAPPGNQARAAYEAPRNSVEQALAAIWSGVLGIEKIGRGDNFFSLGGDSILSIQVGARARQAGLSLTIRQLFQNPTIAALAPLVTTAQAAAKTAKATQAPLTPVQRWFFERVHTGRDWFNQSMLFEPGRKVDAGRLMAALRAVFRAHPALHLRFSDSTQWSGESRRDAVVRVDLSALAENRQRAALEDAARRVQSSLDIANGPLARAVWFDRAEPCTARLLLVFHHLVIDGVSWRILMDDLKLAYERMLEPAGASYLDWAAQLAGDGASAGAEEEACYWTSERRAGVKPLPLDRNGRNIAGSAADVTAALSAADTELLLREIHEAYRTEAQDILLAAVAGALAEWTGERTVLLDMESHGRGQADETLDIMRAVGWFTSVYPLALTLPEAQSPGETIKAVKEQLRSVPRGGARYGLLRYGTDHEMAARLRTMPAAQVSFNYLGQVDASIARDELLRVASEPSGPARAPGSERTHLLEVNALVAGGRLRMSWSYSRELHRRETIEALAGAARQRLEALIAHCRRGDAGGRTPSDFPLAGLDQAMVDRIAGADREIQDIYPLSPAQEGMLFHTEYEPDSGMYVEQLAWTLLSSLDRVAFRRAWERVAERHDVLRTAFPGAGARVQVVYRRAPVPILEQDWRELSGAGQSAMLTRFLAADRVRGFDRSRPPLMRLTVIRIADERYEVVWTFHHSLLDGWSLPILLKEVFALYLDPAAALPPVHSYRDYIAWLGRRDLDGAEAYWRKALAGFEAPSRLRTEAPRREEEPGERILHVTEEASARLEAFCRRHGLTMNTILQGAWAILVSRYSGRDDVVFGTTVSIRPAEMAGSETMPGVFINTLPVRVWVNGAERLVSWLKRLQDEQSEMRQYDFAPLVKIQRWSDIAAGEQLFETCLVYVNYPVDSEIEAQSQNVGLRALRFIERTNYPLTIAVAPGREIRLRFAYHGARFHPPVVARLMEQYETVLRRICEDAEIAVGEVSLAGQSDRVALDQWNRTAAAYSGGTAVERFEQIASERHDATAVTLAGEHLSYGELNRRVNRLAHYLIQSGVGPETPVAVCLERSPSMLVAVWGIWKAGGAYVPLDPRYPVDRLSWLLDDSGAAVLISELAVSDRLPWFAGVTVWMDQDEAAIATCPRANPGRRAELRNLAYVIYTSGSGGQPKGVLIEHRGIMNLAGAQVAQFGVNPSSRILQFASLSFDASVFEMAMALLHGAVLCLGKREWMAAGAEFQRLLAEQAITHLTIPPSVLGAVEPEPGRALEAVIVAGEACPAALVERWARDRRMYNAYGPTETTVWATVERCVPGPEAPAIGRAIANFRAYVVDGHGNAAPPGVAGELYLGGAGLARGYLGRPDLTADRFVPDYLGGAPGARLYRTGDLTRYTAGGKLEYLGRIDSQVKIRGYRIEPGEIEAALRRHEAVREAAVIASSSAAPDRQLVAYVVPRGLPDADLKKGIYAHLGDLLPEYLLPGAIVFIDALPLTPNGKVDRSALESLGESAAPDATADGPPRNPAEQAVDQIWREVLGLAQISRTANFFEIGGHSLLAAQIVSRLRALFGIELEMRALFETTTIAGMALRIGRQLNGARGTWEPPTIGRRERAGEAELAYAQQRLWFMEQLRPGTTAYNIPLAVELEGDLHPAALARSLDAIVERHEILRTRFESLDGRPCQVIEPAARQRFGRVDLTGIGGERREAEARRVVARESSQGFDLSAGPAWRGWIMRLERNRHSIVWTLHHIITDGWSMGVLARELGKTYAAHRSGRPAELPPLSIQYADYAEWQRVWLSGARLEQELEYWRRQLVDAPVLELPADPAAATDKAGVERLRLGAELVDGLRTLGRREDVTLFMTLLAAFAAVLARYSGQSRIVLGTPTAGRQQPETEGLIGFFVNMLALRTDLSGDPPFRELLARVRETALDAYAHQDAPFEKIVEAVQPERSLVVNPVFQAVLALQNNSEPRLTLSGLTVRPVAGSARAAKFDLTLTAVEAAGGLDLELEYRSGMFRPDMIANMLGGFGHILKQAAADPDRRISSMSARPEQCEAAPAIATGADVTTEHLERLLIELGSGAARPSPE